MTSSAALDQPIVMERVAAMLNTTLQQPRKGKKAKSTVSKASALIDDCIMDTNNSSIVSKRSVEKLYYPGQKEYFRYFVKKFQRRSPLINRGYWLRMKAVDTVIRKFLTEREGLKKVVVNLGCGYDPNPFEYLGRHPDLCKDVTFVDVDYPQLMHKKYDTIKANEPLHTLFPDLELQPTGSTIIAKSSKYLAVGCDLRELDKLEAVLRSEFDMSTTPVSILFTAEVSVAYMTLAAANNVFKWASTFEDVRFCLLEQQIPDGRDHPFAQTMLKHFEKLRTPLHAVGTVDEMKARFRAAGWPAEGLDIRSLWELWSDDGFLTPQQRMDLDKIEPFDEWEEFALFGSHYFLMDAQKRPDMRVESIEVSASHEPESMKCRGQTYSCLPLQGEPSHRRFAATMASSDKSIATIGLHGGLGTRERLNDCVTYTSGDDVSKFTAPSLPTGLMCHTITEVSDKDYLLVGGRASPDKASAACWYSKGGTWSKVHDLPEGRYRHCAVTFADESMSVSCVIVFGGRNSAGDVLSDWLLWTGQTGWKKLETTGDIIEPRFGAAMALSASKSKVGIITGGMRKDGTVINDVWRFEIVRAVDGAITISLNNDTQTYSDTLGGGMQFLGRFGAVLVPTTRTMLLVGGVAADNLLGRKHEILDLDNTEFIEIASQHRPLLTGFSAVCSDIKENESQSDILVIGGGATCFSFGTNWNDGCLLRTKVSEAPQTEWCINSPHQKAKSGTSEKPDTAALASDLKSRKGKKSTKGKKKTTPISRRTIQSAADFELIRNESRPVILTGIDIGPCTTQWTNDYLKSQIGESRQVVIHSSPTPHMNFQTKNFSYTTQSFGSFLDDAINGSHLYLRALSADKPSDKPTNLAEDFPSIAPDFVLPQELQYVQNNMHSSPFRISGPVTMWLHYDVMANILCQIRGHKRLLLFSPTEVSRLSFPAGASSSTINPFTDGYSAQAHEALLQPGDILFLPPLWMHAAEPTEGLSVAVNVFFREAGMDFGYAAGRDVYGNRDLAGYERGRRDLQKVVKGFEGLPRDVRSFYLARLADELKEMSKT